MVWGFEGGGRTLNAFAGCTLRGRCSSLGRQTHEVARPVAPLRRRGDVGIRQGWRLTRRNASSRRMLSCVCVCVRGSSAVTHLVEEG